MAAHTIRKAEALDRAQAWTRRGDKHGDGVAACEDAEGGLSCQIAVPAIRCLCKGVKEHMSCNITPVKPALANDYSSVLTTTLAPWLVSWLVN